jgi:hypothetical protein
MVKEKLHKHTSNAEYNIYACTVVTIQAITIQEVSGQGKHKRYSRKTPISTYPILPNS